MQSACDIGFNVIPTMVESIWSSRMGFLRPESLGVLVKCKALCPPTIQKPEQLMNQLGAPHWPQACQVCKHISMAQTLISRDFAGPRSSVSSPDAGRRPHTQLPRTFLRSARTRSGSMISSLSCLARWRTFSPWSRMFLSLCWKLVSFSTTTTLLESSCTTCAPSNGLLDPSRRVGSSSAPITCSVRSTIISHTLGTAPAVMPSREACISLVSGDPLTS